MVPGVIATDLMMNYVKRVAAEQGVDEQVIHDKLMAEGVLKTYSTPEDVANLALFWLALQYDVFRAETARVFFVWVSVFNLFAVSVFWSFMADIFGTEQGKRLFGFIAAGGTAGTLLGSAATVTLAERLGTANLLIVAGILLELAIFCAMALERACPRREEPIAPQADIRTPSQTIDLEIHAARARCESKEVAQKHDEPESGSR